IHCANCSAANLAIFTDFYCDGGYRPKRDPSRLILREQRGRRSPAGLILEYASFCSALSITTKQASFVLRSTTAAGRGARRSPSIAVRARRRNRQTRASHCYALHGSDIVVELAGMESDHGRRSSMASKPSTRRKSAWSTSTHAKFTLKRAGLVMAIG